MLLISELSPGLGREEDSRIRQYGCNHAYIYKCLECKHRPIPEAISVPILSGAFAAVDRQ